jgi:hypothetical protein
LIASFVKFGAMKAMLYVGHCSNWEIFTTGEVRKQPFSFKLVRLYPPERLHFMSTCPSRELTEGRKRISVRTFNTYLVGIPYKKSANNAVELLWIW